MLAEPAQEMPVAAVTRVVASPDSRFIATVEETAGGTVVRVLSCCSTASLVLSVSTDAIAAVLEDPHVDSLEWSADGQFLKIAASDRAEDYAVMVVEPGKGAGSLRPVMVGGSPAAWGSWSTNGHDLYVASTAEPDEGIYVVDPSRGAAKALLTGYKVATDLSVTARFILAKVERSIDGAPAYSLVSIDRRTGAVAFLQPVSE